MGNHKSRFTYTSETVFVLFCFVFFQLSLFTDFAMRHVKFFPYVADIEGL